MTHRKEIPLCILSAVLLILSYPIFNLEFLAWFGFVPLFFAIQGKSKSKAFLFSFITGVIFWCGTIYWLHHVSWPGFILLVLYLSLYFGFFGIFFVLLSINDKRSTINVLLIPVAWVLLEWLRSTGPTGFGWALLGYSQYLNLPIIQIADITGVWGVSFLVMMVNFAIWKALFKVKEYFDLELLIIFGLFICVLSYGYYKLYFKPSTLNLKPVKISIIQGNIPQYQKWDEDFQQNIFNRYEMLTKEAARMRPDLIIWPESSLPWIVDENSRGIRSITRLAKEVKVPILAGVVAGGSARSESDMPSYYNSAMLISENGEILQQYNKLHLVPFGEYIPFERHIPFIREYIDKPIGDYSPGNKYTVFDHKTKFGVLICFEDIMPHLAKRFVKKGADLLVNITNDAWFMKTSAPYQHAQPSVFRAIENRVPVVRCANTGLSCFIDRFGRIYDKVRVDNEDIFVVGYKTAVVR